MVAIQRVYKQTRFIFQRMQCFIYYSPRRSFSSIRAELSGPRGSLEAVMATWRKPAQISSPTLRIFVGEISKPSLNRKKKIVVLCTYYLRNSKFSSRLCTVVTYFLKTLLDSDDDHPMHLLLLLIFISCWWKIDWWTKFGKLLGRHFFYFKGFPLSLLLPPLMKMKF